MTVLVPITRLFATTLFKYSKNWMTILKEQTQKGTEMNQMLQEVLDTREDSKHLDFNAALQSVFNFQAFLNKKMLQAIEEWERNK